MFNHASARLTAPIAMAASPPEMSGSKAKAFRFIDLFAGIGGFRSAFEGIGGKCVFTSEWNKFSQQTYGDNFQSDHPISGDIREFSKDPGKIPEHDVLLAGFPCQPFSISGVSKKNSLGRPHGFLDDTQGTLFFDLAKIIEHHRPRIFCLENVKNLESHDKGKTFATIMHVLTSELGYHVSYRVLNAKSWLPQNRARIIIVGFRDQTDFDLNDLDVPDPANGPKLKSILDANENVDPKYTLKPKTWSFLQDYRKKHESKGNGFGYTIADPEGIARCLSARYYKDGSEILIAQDGKPPRRLTPAECARLMGFTRPDRPFKITVSDTQAYHQFGNAVPPPMMEFVAQHLKPHLQ